MKKSWKVFVVFTVLATVLAIPGVALAHHTAIDFDSDCLLRDLSFDFDYTIHAETINPGMYSPEDLQHEKVAVKIYYDGILAQSYFGKFIWNNVPGVYPSITGSGTAPAGTSEVRIIADPVDVNWHDGTPPLADSSDEKFKAPTEPCFDNPGTGTPGYWKNHPDAWPVGSIMIGGVTYTKAAAIGWMQTPVRGDKTLSMFPALVSAKLNVLIGNDSSCISSTIKAADAWMTVHGPVGSNVRANSAAWGAGSPLHSTLDDYNNGKLCAPHRD